MFGNSNTTRSVSSRRAGFTLIETLVVMTIISMMLSLLVPWTQRVRESARDVICSGTLKQIGEASAQYAFGNQGWAVHGADEAWADFSLTSNGRKFYFTNVYDDDWWDAKPGIPGRNAESDGAQNICGVGQLMWDNYLPERAEAIACPQTDYREGFNASGSVKRITLSTVRATFKANPPGSVTYWRLDNYTGSPSYAGFSSTYTTRGPLTKIDTMSPKMALFSDQEQALQSLIAYVPLSGSPLPYGWGRVHKEGFNTLYVDDSVSMFHDPDRSLSYWAFQARYYGTGDPLMRGFYDRQ